MRAVFKREVWSECTNGERLGRDTSHACEARSRGPTLSVKKKTTVLQEIDTFGVNFRYNGAYYRRNKN